MIVQKVVPTQTDIDNILSLEDAKRFIRVVGIEDDTDIPGSGDRLKNADIHLFTGFKSGGGNTVIHSKLWEWIASIIRSRTSRRFFDSFFMSRRASIISV